MAERGRKEPVYKGNRLHIFPLVSEQVQWSQHKASPKQRQKGTDVVVCLECHPGFRNGEIWSGGSVSVTMWGLGAWKGRSHETQG